VGGLKIVFNKEALIKKIKSQLELTIKHPIKIKVLKKFRSRAKIFRFK
jgi:hypothetical protein